MVYFVRVNGRTLHNNPKEPSHYVPQEPPCHPVDSFNYVNFCLGKGIVRIGWPDTGDLLAPTEKVGSLAHGYSLSSLASYKQDYLRSFAGIPAKSIIMMPDIAHPGLFYMGVVDKTYHYEHNVPTEPYENAHRLGVSWDQDSGGAYRHYQAADFGIRGGFWRKAFFALDNSPKTRSLIPSVLAARSK